MVGQVEAVELGAVKLLQGVPVISLAESHEFASGFRGVEMTIGRIEHPVQLAGRRPSPGRFTGFMPPSKPHESSQKSTFLQVPEPDRRVVAAADQHWEDTVAR